MLGLKVKPKLNIANIISKKANDFIEFAPRK